MIRTIETARLVLRPLNRDDLDPWAAFLADAETTRLLHFPQQHSREESERLLERTIERQNGDVAMYAARLREAGETIGFVGYSPRELDWGQELELGWLLLRHFHGRGYATEAARAVRQLVPDRVISLIRIENEASLNVARKVGMTREREMEFAGFQTSVFASASR
ncbi:MAG TPA: GNAT family N-acetyltransferase [Gaiellaceae bacterium]|nr:GNAT family N-acetyltransferase [Gaiellaceae bacterium]